MIVLTVAVVHVTNYLTPELSPRPEEVEPNGTTIHWYSAPILTVVAFAECSVGTVYANLGQQKLMGLLGLHNVHSSRTRVTHTSFRLHNLGTVGITGESPSYTSKEKFRLIKKQVTTGCNIPTDYTVGKYPFSYILTLMC